MPNQIKFDNPPAGYAIRAAKDGEPALIQYSEFTSTEDGQHFVNRLEGLPNEILEMLPVRIKPSQVDTMLAVILRDGTATVYVNEVEQIATILPAGPIIKGQAVTKNDVSDIDRLDLGISIPDDAGVLFIFSVGWRKGLFYDFGPLVPSNSRPRDYDVTRAFGQAYCQVLFQERFSINDQEWESLFESQWFPFTGLRQTTIDQMIAYIRSGWNADELINEIASDVEKRSSSMLDCWRRHPTFEPHIAIFERAVERFLDKDFISCTALLFPRIEGLLRTHLRGVAIRERPSQSNLAAKAVASKIESDGCLLLPHRFQGYLERVYFADFHPADTNIDVSRNSVAHGVAETAAFNEKSATIALLVIHQLFYFLDRREACTKPVAEQSRTAAAASNS